MYDNLAMVMSPIHIVIVLVIVLIVYGPKRLPDIGKQIGTALRDLNKAKEEVMRTMSLTHEPDPEPYKYNGYTNDYSSSYNTYTPEPDLTDYTISGQPPVTQSIEGTVARNSSSDVDLDAYSLSGAAPASDASAVSHSESSASTITAAVDSDAPKGERHA
jgi:TatA/E family protein of Tat protein translocase